ncbi:MAG: Tropinesterase [Anaerolineales bacterium]|nr:Tropinesterase [Anaerolineales bacterium]
MFGFSESAPDSHFATVNQLRLHYLDWGGPGEVPIVMLPGITRPAQDFNLVASRLAKHRRTMAVDLRGHGDSEWEPEGRYNFDSQVGDLLGLMGHWGIVQAAWVGTSFGGLVAMVLAAEHPASVECLVMNDIGPEIAPEGAARIHSAAGKDERFTTYDDAVARFRERYSTIGDWPMAVWREVTRHSVRQLEDGMWAFKHDPAVRTATTLDDPWSLYDRVQAPTLVIRGAESDILAPETAEEMSRRGPSATVVEVPDRGHAPLLTEPAAWEALQDFLLTE